MGTPVFELYDAGHLIIDLATRMFRGLGIVTIGGSVVSVTDARVAEGQFAMIFVSANQVTTIESMAPSAVVSGSTITFYPNDAATSGWAIYGVF